MCGRFGNRVYISRILTCSFRSRFFSDTIYYTWTFIGYLAEIFELAEDFHGGEADCKKNLSTLDGLYNNSLLMGAPPHMAILPG